MHAPRRPAIKLAYREGDRCRFSVTGDVDPREWLTAYEGFVQTEPAGHVLWDLTGGSLNVLSSADVRDLARRVGEIRDRQHADGRVALVCARDVDFGIARMLVVYAGCVDPNGPMQVFRDSDAAWRWLSDPRDAAFAEEPGLVEWRRFSSEKVRARTPGPLSSWCGGQPGF